MKRKTLAFACVVFALILAVVAGFVALNIAVVKDEYRVAIMNKTCYVMNDFKRSGGHWDQFEPYMKAEIKKDDYIEKLLEDYQIKIANGTENVDVYYLGKLVQGKHKFFVHQMIHVVFNKRQEIAHGVGG